VALAYEDLAYARYVKEYNSGKFKEARSMAEKALRIMRKLLPVNHLHLASSQRVLALILEEIAIDSVNEQARKSYLEKAESLHLDALDLSLEAFGENNIQVKFVDPLFLSIFLCFGKTSCVGRFYVLKPQFLMFY
jgi:hypothetical protein